MAATFLDLLCRLEQRSAIDRFRVMADFAPFVIPNPTSGTATLNFVLARPGPLTIRIYDTTGRWVHTLIDRSMMEAGRHTLVIPGVDPAGRALRSGIYHYVIEAGNGDRSGRFAIVR